MKNLRVVASLCTLLFIFSRALAQTGDQPPLRVTPEQSQTSAAGEQGSPPNPCGTPAARGKTFCEVAQRRQGPPFAGRPGGGYPRYPGPPRMFGEYNAGHTAIGALIGLGLGASLAGNTHPNHQTGFNIVGAMFGGGFGALVGGIVGRAIPPSHHSRFHRQSWPDPDEDELGSRTRSGVAEQTASARFPKSLTGGQDNSSSQTGRYDLPPHPLSCETFPSVLPERLDP